MEPTEDTDDAVERKYSELCLDLNMDKRTKEESWESYQKIQTKYTLEGDQMHWLACALYEACRRSVTPTVGRGTMEGNGVSLTRLLRSAKFSLIQFFNKMKKWSDMAGLPQEFIDKVNKLERNFAVSTVIFKKYEPIFLDLFQHSVDYQQKQNRNKKQRRLPCTSNEVFNFCWTMYVQVKGHFPAISDDLVNSYHLLLCCLDWFYANALMGGRKDILNPSFEGLPEDFGNKDWKPPNESPCIIQLLCEKHEGLEIEAKVIKEHWWKPHIKKLFDKKILKGKPETLSAVLEVGNFDANKKSISEAYEEYPLNYSSKSMNNEYEAYVLSVGDFDERVFLGSEADEEIGTPTKYREEGTGELAERLQVKAHLQQHFDETKTLAPSTPLTGRRYLKEKDPSTTPVSTATQSVNKLQSLLLGRKALPSDDLLDIFSEIGSDPKTRIMERVDEMGEVFCSHYVQETEDHAGSQIDFAQKRLQLGECLYYKMLESVLFNEKKRMDNKEGKSALSTLMEQEIFHRSLFACCLEIVIFSYNSQRSFPWILEIFNLSPYHFYKVIEIIIRNEDGLSRDVVKHLNHIEENILESLVWRSESPLWEAIKEGSVPGCEDVVLPEHDVMKNVKHPAVIRVSESQQPKRDPLMSPPPGVSAADRFSSPSPGSAKRRLFSVLTQPTETLVPSENTPVESSTSTTSTKTTQIIAFQQAQTNDGRQILIPVHTIIHSGAKDDKKEPAKMRPKKTGSLALFFRKLYHLASVRLRDLCEQLYLDDIELRKKMWTCFEYVLVNHVELMMDRHIDQIIMCAIYVMAKVSDHPQSFTDIMRCYRLQPQAESHVYRSVLLSCRTRRNSGESDSSKNGTSGQSSPVNVENAEKQRSEKLPTMRSSSTLPIPHPGSHPPTPTILIQSASGGEEGEERGDLIMFYNRVFVEKVKKFAQKFSAQKNSKDCPPLSPLPTVKSQTASPRRVSSKHSIYLSPHKPTLLATPMATGLSYSFQKSPAKDLRAINNMIKMKDFREGKKILGKRQLDVTEEDEGPQTKQLCTGFSFLKRLQNVSSERQEAHVLKLD
ncbi:retinoblastoma-like protein 1 isoform X3 [Ostrea edulis]|uniref:retinoblastoma-like protein 1 isoform X3 n=1 Tax=Ostrea edulis TaxID=37623 RepID=UPI0024AF4D14|nr:retinoblastoma-like protein 1 isoform X3 [Ostrea edulis]